MNCNIAQVCRESIPLPEIKYPMRKGSEVMYITVTGRRNFNLTNLAR